MSDGCLDSGTSVWILFLTNLHTNHADSISELGVILDQYRRSAGRAKFRF